MEFKTIGLSVPIDAEIFDDQFTPEENYQIIKIGREHILSKSKAIVQNNNLFSNKTIEKLEGQIEILKRELLKYGVIIETLK